MSKEKPNNLTINSVKYISVMSYLLKYRGLFGREKDLEREKYNSYPVYLKHTIFHDDENMRKFRTLEISHRFLSLIHI